VGAERGYPAHVHDLEGATLPDHRRLPPSRRDVLGWSALAAGSFALAACGSSGGGGVPGSRALKDRAQIGVNHPLNSVATLERDLGHQFPILGGMYYSFDTIWSEHLDDLVPVVGRELLVCWMPKKQDATVVLADIPRGVYDAHLDQMLAGMRAVPGPVVVRWGHEANGNWYPWSAASSGPLVGITSPAQYVAAWRYIVARERALPGRSNIRWFWCPNATDVASKTGEVFSLEQYWPGEQWVDLVGCDGYNEPTAWTSFDAVFKRPYERVTALSSKPFWIGETGCHEPLPSQHGTGTKGEWIAAMLNSTAFPSMEAVCYFDYDARYAGRADWRFDSTAATFASVARSLRAIG
jgi:mannan endo-1,4-beta-mannosidase